MNQNPKRVLKQNYRNERCLIGRQKINESKPEEGTETYFRHRIRRPGSKINESKPEEGTERCLHMVVDDGGARKINESKPEEGTETACK